MDEMTAALGDRLNTLVRATVDDQWVESTRLRGSRPLTRRGEKMVLKMSYKYESCKFFVTIAEMQEGLDGVRRRDS
jgi:hypothetical protein